MTAAILSMRKLARTVGVPIERLLAIERDLKEDHRLHYRFFSLPAGPGKVRHIRPPKPELMAVQRRIVKAILQPLGLDDSAHGGVPGRSPSSNALAHAGQPRLLKVDVKKFFDNVGHRQVHQTLRRHGFGRDVARLLTRLLTLRGSLPQGGASSPAMANLFASMSIDSALAPSIAQRGLQYTRFVDDLTISGKTPQDVLQEVAGLLSAQGLKINRKKLAITPNSARQEVTGLVTNDANRLSISRRRRDAVRAAIYQIKRDAPPESELQRRVRSVSGRIAQIERLHPREANRLRSYLEKMLSADARLTPILTDAS